MKITSKTPGLRIVGGTAYGSIGTEFPSSSEGISRRPEPPRLVIDPAVTETARNGRLREQRYQIWREAEAATRYWRIRLDFNDAVEQAQRMGIQEGSYHPVADPTDRRSHEERRSIVERWREALARQLLTPASHVAHIAWKQATLAGRQIAHTNVKPERLKCAIADDLAWLAAHPVRQSNRKAAGDE